MADEQPEQGVLHVGFKLSADGEVVGLYQQAGGTLNLLDEKIFPLQSENTSYARIPDKTGPFMATDILTPGSENIKGVVSLEKNDFDDSMIFPNPTQDRITVSTTTQAELTLLDLMGRTIYTAATAGGTTEIILPKENGLYLLRLKSKAETKTMKVIKQ